jgi:hypothetical protein
MTRALLPVRSLVLAALNQGIEDIASLIHGAPEVRTLPFDRQKHPSPIPLVTRPSTPEMQVIGILRVNLAAPLAKDLIYHDHSACKQQHFDIAVAQQSRKYSHTAWLMISTGKRWFLHWLVGAGSFMCEPDTPRG